MKYTRGARHGLPTPTKNINTNANRLLKEIEIHKRGKTWPTLSLLPAFRDGGNYTGHYRVGGATCKVCPPMMLMIINMVVIMMRVGMMGIVMVEITLVITSLQVQGMSTHIHVGDIGDADKRDEK